MGANLFGRSYTTVGSSDSDYLIKTKGQIKVQWGSKFIDLIKDGKINIDSSIINSVKSKDKIGSSNGIYVTPDGQVYLRVGENILALAGETTFISFLAEQTTDSTQKYTALKNIGFIYEGLDSLNENSLQNGIIYIEDTQKLYIVQNGNLVEYTAPMSSSISSSFTISKDDSSIGALVINGEGIENSLAFNSLYIYSTSTESIINSTKDLTVEIEDSPLVFINSDSIKASVGISAPSISSNNFEVYTEGLKTTLTVDRIVTKELKNSSDAFTSVSSDLWNNSTLLQDFTTIWTINSDNTITGIPTEEEFIVDSGSEGRWGNLIWKTNFLEVILCNVLNQNSEYYSNDNGWAFYNEQIVTSTGSSGYWSGLLQETKITEDSTIHTTLRFKNISGQIFDNNQLIHFNFTDVEVNDKLPIRFGYTTEKVGDEISSNLDLYNVTFSKCFYKIETLLE